MTGQCSESSAVPSDRDIRAQLHRRATELTAFQAASLSIAVELDVQQLGERIAEAVRALAGARCAVISIWYSPGQRTAGFHVAGIGPDVRRKLGRPARSSGRVASLLRSGQPLRVDDIAADSRFSGLPPGHPPIRNLLGVPIFLHGEVVGCMYVADREDGRLFDSQDEQLLTGFSALAAASLDRARLTEATRQRALREEIARADAAALASRLHENNTRLVAAAVEAQQRVEAIEALYQATEQVAGSRTLEPILETVLDVARRLFAADRAAIYLQQETGGYVCPASIGLSTAYTEAVSLHPLIPRDPRAPGGRQATFISDLQAARRGTPLEALVAAEGVQTVLALPLLRHGEPIGTLSIYHDRTRQYNAEEMRVAQALANQAAVGIAIARLIAEVGKLEAIREVDRLKSEFIATVSHELRTPLSLVFGYAELLLNRDIPSDAARPMLEGIYLGAKQLADLVDGVIDISEIERGHLKLEVGDVDLLALLTESIDAIAATHTDRRLVANLPSGRLSVDGDFRRLRQVVLSLLSNAVRYSSDGGTITVRATADSGRVEVSVADEGIGMTPEQLGRAFEKFYRGKSNVMHESPGIGLGLAISRHIVEGHGGQIWAESRGPGLGTTFHFSLPLPSRSGHPPGYLSLLRSSDD